MWPGQRELPFLWMGETERQGPRTVGSGHSGSKLLLDSCCRSERPGGGRRSRDIHGQETEGLTKGRRADENLRLRTSWAPGGEEAETGPGQDVREVTGENNGWVRHR